MNVIFHIATAIGITTLIIDTSKINANAKFKIAITFVIFSMAFFSHGILDYIPHCYPINSKIDFISGLLIVIIFTFLVKKPYKLIIVFAFGGSIFPDLIDLAPAILNKYLEFNLPIHKNVFPWHWPEYSGSLYNRDCGVSTLNHILLMLTITAICLFKWKKLKEMIYKN